MPFAEDALNYRDKYSNKKLTPSKSNTSSLISLNNTYAASNKSAQQLTQTSNLLDSAKKIYESGRYTNSKLAAKKYSTPFQSKRKYRIERITPHCLPGRFTLDQICGMFPSSRKDKASCNYAIGKDGSILLMVEEDKKANTSSSSDNDHRAITIECSTSPTDPYEFNNTEYTALVNLCADICRRNGKTQLIWLGDKAKTLAYQPKWYEMVLTVHRWFKQKACPGDWLVNHMTQLAADVTALIPKIPADGAATTDGTTYTGEGDFSSGYGASSGGALYTTKNTRIDATVREVAYLTPEGDKTLDASKKSIKNYKLSVVNYTSFLGAILGGSGGSLSNGAYGNGQVDTSGITNSNCRQIFDILLSKGMTASQCVGILANMKQESGWNPAAVNKSSGASGLCQWLGGRRTAMIAFVGSDWRNNLSGQVDFLLHELQTSEKKAGDALYSITEVSEDAAKRCADSFLRLFERPGNYSNETIQRQRYASEIWSQIVIQPTSGSSNGQLTSSKGSMRTNSGKTISSGNQISIPGTVAQTRVNSGIWEYWDRKGMGHSNWSASSVQRKLYDIWVQKGKKSNNLVATLDGYYLIAVTTKFGNTGDMLSVVLNDGTYFNAIMADGKSYHDSNSTPYGHKSGNLINIVEWCTYDPSGNFQKSRNKNNMLKDALKSAGMNPDSKTGQTIAYIVNYGSWLG